MVSLISKKWLTQRNAILSKKREKHLVQRDQKNHRIKVIGRKEWKKEIDYHQRSLSETAMFRYKTSIGVLEYSYKQVVYICFVKSNLRILLLICFYRKALNEFNTLITPT